MSVPDFKDEKSPRIIRCSEPDWESAVKDNLKAGVEVDLVLFNNLDTEVCRQLGTAHGMVFTPDTAHSFEDAAPILLVRREFNVNIWLLSVNAAARAAFTRHFRARVTLAKVMDHQPSGFQICAEPAHAPINHSDVAGTVLIDVPGDIVKAVENRQPNGVHPGVLHGSQHLLKGKLTVEPLGRAIAEHGSQLFPARGGFKERRRSNRNLEAFSQLRSKAAG
jgi:hypothetical protein